MYLYMNHIKNSMAEKVNSYYQLLLPKFLRQTVLYIRKIQLSVNWVDFFLMTLFTSAKMIKTIYLNRIGNEPWGFRLCGGIDLDQPVTITKVSKKQTNFVQMLIEICWILALHFLSDCYNPCSAEKFLCESNNI